MLKIFERGPKGGGWNHFFFQLILNKFQSKFNSEAQSETIFFVNFDQEPQLEEQGGGLVAEGC